MICSLKSEFFVLCAIFSSLYSCLIFDNKVTTTGVSKSRKSKCCLNCRPLPRRRKVVQNRRHLAEASRHRWLHAGVRLSRKWQRRVDVQTCGWVKHSRKYISECHVRFMYRCSKQKTNSRFSTSKNCKYGRAPLCPTYVTFIDFMWCFSTGAVRAFH